MAVNSPALPEAIHASSRLKEMIERGLDQIRSLSNTDVPLSRPPHINPAGTTCRRRTEIS